jgi:GntR family transcriptional regulator
MTPINRESPIPAYYQIALDIRKRILQNEWVAGQRIPSENELAKAYGVSRITMRQALAELEKDGILDRRHGIGTFVNQEPIPLIHDLNLPHIVAGRLRKMGIETSSRTITAQTFADPLPEVQANLRLTATTPVAYLKRVLLIRNEPTALNRSWFNHLLCPGITEQPLVESSLSKTLQERYGLIPARADTWLEVIRCTSETAHLLDSVLDMPMILVRSVSYLPDGTSLEYSTTEWLGDRIRFNFQTAFTQDSPNETPGSAMLLGKESTAFS